MSSSSYSSSHRNMNKSYSSKPHSRKFNSPTKRDSKSRHSKMRSLNEKAKKEITGRFLSRYEEMFKMHNNKNTNRDKLMKTPSPSGKKKKKKKKKYGYEDTDDEDTSHSTTPGRALANCGHRLFPAPAITAKSWVVADFKTGKILWERNSKKRLPMASITKIITALCVFDICKKNRKNVQTELVTVSKLAAVTIGTSACLKTGDKLSALELLYGMMLPSGNDAACALAEYFGGKYLLKEKVQHHNMMVNNNNNKNHTNDTSDRNYESKYNTDDDDDFLVPEIDDYASDTTVSSDASSSDNEMERTREQQRLENNRNNSKRYINAFVAYMNEKIVNDVKVNDTTFKNPHGMDQDGHTSTAYDIAQIASYTMQKEKTGILQQIVRTVEYNWKSKFNNKDPKTGKLRQCRWLNTNKLLFRNKSVTGFKTGVTRNAGPCLASSMKMEKGIEILVVTLDSSSRQSRWTEHTKMFKWACKNLGVKAKNSVRYKNNSVL